MAKFQVGDEVTVKGHGDGVIVEVAVHDAHHLREYPQQYGVKLLDWEWNPDKKKYTNPLTGEERDHKADTLGCVEETDIEAI